MPYAILRFAKKKMGTVNSTGSHNERTKQSYKSNPGIDVEKISLNYHIIEPKNTYRKTVENLVMKNKCKTRKDSTYLVETLITASPEFMKALPPERQREYFIRATEFMKKQVGKENIVSAVVHMDESNPHMHLSFCPITPDKRLSAKDILGNQASLSNWQTIYHQHMNERWPELERGISSFITKRKHIPVWLYKLAERLDVQYGEISATLADLNVFNAGKKRNSALKTLSKWIPEAEKFTARLKSMDDYISSLQASVKNQTDISDYWKEETSDVKKKLEDLSYKAYKMREQIDKQDRLLSKIPQEILEQYTKNKKSREMER